MSLEGLSKYKESKNKTQSKYVRLSDGESIKIRPLQELDADSANFSPKNGVALWTKEWQNPDDFTKSCVDTTEDEGACVGAEMLTKYGWGTQDNKGWRPKDFCYLNVLVDNGKDEPYVGILKMNTAPKAVQYNALVNFYEGSDDKSITNRWWRFSRTGAGTYDTTYSLTPLDKDTSLPSVEEYELLDLNEASPRVPYASQRLALGVDAWEAKHNNAAANEAPAEQSTPSAIKW